MNTFPAARRRNDEDMSDKLSSIQPSRRCVARSQGEFPGEWHESQVSYLQHKTGTPVVSIRHLESGMVSHVDLEDVVFGVDAERYMEQKETEEA